jgi:hypothetical protein
MQVRPTNALGHDMQAICQARQSKECSRLASPSASLLAQRVAYQDVCPACAVSMLEERLSAALRIANQLGIDNPSKQCPVCHCNVLVSNMKRTTGKPVCAACYDALSNARKEFMPTFEELMEIT